MQARPGPKSLVRFFSSSTVFDQSTLSCSCPICSLEHARVQVQNQSVQQAHQTLHVLIHILLGNLHRTPQPSHALNANADPAINKTAAPHHLMDLLTCQRRQKSGINQHGGDGQQLGTCQHTLPGCGPSSSQVRGRAQLHARLSCMGFEACSPSRDQIPTNHVPPARVGLTRSQSQCCQKMRPCDGRTARPIRDVVHKNQHSRPSIKSSNEKERKIST